MATSPIPFYVLCGALGAGKTTLLMRLLEYWKSQGKKTGVLMNEAGEVSIDGPRAGTIAEPASDCTTTPTSSPCSVNSSAPGAMAASSGSAHTGSAHCEVSTGANDPMNAGCSEMSASDVEAART